MMQPMSIRAAVLSVALLAVGCQPDPMTDGRYWRQPVSKPGLRSMTPTVGIAGTSAHSDVGAGFTVSGWWRETGGGDVGRAGYTAESLVSRDRTTSVGDIPAPTRAGIMHEWPVPPDVHGRTAGSGVSTETSTVVGVER